MSSPHDPSVLLNAPPPPAALTRSLHDALPISAVRQRLADRPTTLRPDLGNGPAAHAARRAARYRAEPDPVRDRRADRKSTRLNSSHVAISYAVFCLKNTILIIVS